MSLKPLDDRVRAPTVFFTEFKLKRRSRSNEGFRKPATPGFAPRLAMLSCAVLSFLFFLPALNVKADVLSPVIYSSIGGTPDAALFIADEYGFFKDAGLAFTYHRLDNAAAVLAAVATNQVDAARISLTPGLFSSIQQNMQLRVVGDGQSILHGFAATQFVVRDELAQGTEAAIFERLRGKTIAISGMTSAGGFLLYKLLNRYGLAFADVRIVEMSYPNMLPAFEHKAIDAAIILEPFLSQNIAAGVVRSVSDLVEIAPEQGASIVPLVFSERFLAKPSLSAAFMKAFVRAVRVYTNAIVGGTDRDRVIDIIARRTGAAPGIIQKSNPVGYDPNQRVSTAFLNEAQKFYVKLNFLSKPINLDRLVDPTLAAQAVASLGESR